MRFSISGTLLFLLSCPFSQLSAQGDYQLKFVPGNKVEAITQVNELNNAPALTIEAEVTIDSISDWTHLLSKVVGPTDRISIQTHQGKIYCIVSNGANSYEYTTSSIFAAGEKHHLAMVYDGSLSTKIKLYRDGVQQTMTSSAAALPATTPVNSAVFKVGDPNFKGKIDEVRIWDFAIAGSTIIAWMDTTINPSHPQFSNLKLNWDFNDYLSPDTAHASQNTIYDGLITGAIYEADTTTNNPPVNPLPSDTIVGGYLPYYNISNVTPDIFDYLNQLYYFSLGPDANGNLGRVDGSGVFTPLVNIPTVQSDFDTLFSWKGSKPVKIFLVVGGWVQSKYFDNAVANPVSRANLVANIKSFCLARGIDGVVTDWEAYDNPVVDSDYGLLINELRASFTGTSLLISTAINSTHTSLANEFSNADFIQLMSYGANFGQNTQVPLSTLQNWVNGWVNNGYPKSKIVIGLPAFARTPSDNTSLTYRNILSTYNPAPSRDTVTDSNKLYYFNGINTILQKTQYALDSNLRGVMIWELGQDTIATDPKSLLNAINVLIPVNNGTTSLLPSNQPDEISSLTAFPNPFQDDIEIHFETREPGYIDLTITDLQGKIVWSQNNYYSIGAQQIPIDLKTIQNGLYFFILDTGYKVYHAKLIKL